MIEYIKNTTSANTSTRVIKSSHFLLMHQNLKIKKITFEWWKIFAWSDIQFYRWNKPITIQVLDKITFHHFNAIEKNDSVQVYHFSWNVKWLL